MSVRRTRGRTPLHKATISGSVEVVRMLLKHGSDINAWTNDRSCYALRHILVSCAYLYLYSTRFVYTGPSISVTGLSRISPLSRYLAALVHLASFVLTFLFSLAFPRLRCLPCWSHL